MKGMLAQRWTNAKPIFLAIGGHFCDSCNIGRDGMSGPIAGTKSQSTGTDSKSRKERIWIYASTMSVSTGTKKLSTNAAHITDWIIFIS